MNPAPNLTFVGPMGAGKTSIGRRVAERLQLRFVDVDQWIEEQLGVAVRTVFELEGEAGFRRREREALQLLCAGEGQLIATGGGAVLDPQNRELLAATGYVVWLRVSVEQQLERLARDRSRPLLAAVDRRQRLQAMAGQRDPLYASLADWIFESDSRKVSAAADRLASALRQRWQRLGEAA
jgi:shikimate kinase